MKFSIPFTQETIEIGEPAVLKILLITLIVTFQLTIIGSGATTLLVCIAGTVWWDSYYQKMDTQTINWYYNFSKRWRISPFYTMIAVLLCWYLAIPIYILARIRISQKKSTLYAKNRSKTGVNQE